MSYLLNNQQKVNDIIFANRNKNYGAYVIRSTYGTTLFKSLAFMLLGFGTIMSIAFYYSNRNNDQKLILIDQVDEVDSIYTVSVNLEKKIEQPKPIESSSPRSSGSTASIGTHVVDSLAQETNMVINENITSGNTTGTSTLQGLNNNNSAGNGSVVTTHSVESNPVYIADTEPQFEGGLKALYAFVSSRLKYPQQAREEGKEGTVFVKFVVDQNGKIGNLSLLNNLGYGLDEEALRVVAMIPDFKNPGIVNGKPVKVYYQLPIKFKTQ